MLTLEWAWPSEYTIKFHWGTTLHAHCCQTLFFVEGACACETNLGPGSWIFKNEREFCSEVNRIWNTDTYTQCIITCTRTNSISSCSCNISCFKTTLSCLKASLSAISNSVRCSSSWNACIFLPSLSSSVVLLPSRIEHWRNVDDCRFNYLLIANVQKHSGLC